MASQATAGQVEAQCGEARDAFLAFLESCEGAGPEAASQPATTPAAATPPGAKVYVQQLARMAEADIATLYVNFEHLRAWDEGLAEQVQADYLRLEPHLRKALQNFVRAYEVRPSHLRTKGSCVLRASTQWRAFRGHTIAQTCTFCRSLYMCTKEAFLDAHIDPAGFGGFSYCHELKVTGCVCRRSLATCTQRTATGRRTFGWASSMCPTESGSGASGPR